MPKTKSRKPPAAHEYAGPSDANGGPFYRGECTCLRVGCSKPAYWSLAGTSPALCGNCTRVSPHRRILPQNPAHKERERLAREASAKMATEAAELRCTGQATPREARRIAREAAAWGEPSDFWLPRSAGIGDIRCGRLVGMYADPVLDPAARHYFPNRRATTRADGGLPVPTLSPMLLGPVPMPNGDVALNIENAHQFRKVFASETDAAKPPVRVRHTIGGSCPEGCASDACGDSSVHPAPSAAMLVAMRAAFADPEPHRHKPAAANGQKKKNVPLYSLWVRADGETVYGDYLWSRQFYCTWYERLAPRTPAFRRLHSDVLDGYTICIWGYDGCDLELTRLHTPEGQADAARVMLRHYMDPRKPFGHELVLIALLAIDDEECYPWRVAGTEADI
jgi:hypothetical protein